MTTSVPAVSRVEEAVAAALTAGERFVLAVSGGRDSMVLLDAAARVALTRSLLVATFDHGTGEAAARAVELVAGSAAEHGLPCVIGHADTIHSTEAGWREQRQAFLSGVAEAEEARVATAHTRDDQVETVVIRILREAGARGLAGLYAESWIARPLLAVTRSDVAEYARVRRVRYRADPTNLSRRHLRNRVRLDLLPAIRGVRPRFPEEMLEIAARAAALRSGVAAVVDGLDLMFLDAGTVRIAAANLGGYDAASLRILWPEVASRVGVTMDRRGTERAAAFTIDVIAASAGGASAGRRGSPAARRPGRGGRGRVIQLSGGSEIEHVGDAFVLRGG